MVVLAPSAVLLISDRFFDPANPVDNILKAHKKQAKTRSRYDSDFKKYVVCEAVKAKKCRTGRPLLRSDGTDPTNAAKWEAKACSAKRVAGVEALQGCKVMACCEDLSSV